MKTFANTTVACFISSLASLFYVEPIAYRAGYEQAQALANWVMAPTTLEEAESEKLRCEEVSRETCWISGSFFPESMTIDGGSDSQENNRKQPEAI
jgi:hypothetical protein